LGSLYQSMGQYEPAEKHYKKALGFLEKNPDQNKEQLPSVLLNLALLYKEKKDYEKAIATFDKILPLVDKLYGAESEKTATAYASAGDVMRAAREAERAKAALEKSVLIFEKIGKPEDAAFSYHHLGDVYCEEKNYVEAERCYLKSIELIEARKPGDVRLLSPLAGLAKTYMDQKKATEADAIFKRALDLAEKNLGEEPETALMMLSYGSFLYKEKRTAEAEALFKRALVIQETKLGKDSSEVAYTLNNLAIVATTSKNFTEAEGYLMRAMDIYSKTSGTNSAGYLEVAKTLSTIQQHAKGTPKN